MYIRERGGGAADRTAAASFKPFHELAQKLSESFRCTYFVDQASVRLEDRSAILPLLREHISANLVKVRKRDRCCARGPAPWRS